MFPRRLCAVLAGVLVLTTIGVGPVAAKRPAPTPPPAALPPEPPLTAEQQALADAKAAAAEAYVAAQLREGANLVSLDCVTPNAAPAGESDATTASCSQPWATLSVEARDQTRGHYCGPAVGQVIANYSWKMAAGANKYSQDKLAEWMRTNINGGTNAGDLVVGLEKGTAGSPRRPAGWAWVVAWLTDTDRDGIVADQLHAYVQSNVSSSKMPLAFAVKPHDPNSRYRLASWPRPVNSVGHWIAGYGWYAYFTNSDVPQIAYTDSSRDEGGSTGKFWDPTRHIAALIMEHTRRFVW